jgi:hypothetical protein
LFYVNQVKEQLNCTKTDFTPEPMPPFNGMFQRFAFVGTKLCKIYEVPSDNGLNVDVHGQGFKSMNWQETTNLVAFDLFDNSLVATYSVYNNTQTKSFSVSWMLFDEYESVTSDEVLKETTVPPEFQAICKAK